MSFALDPRLAADSHLLCELPLSRALLMDDARFPWLILVPRIVGAREWIDLDVVDRTRLMEEVTAVGRALEALLTPDKLNLGALGNRVPQLHVHVIARFRDDDAWPEPVWGCGPRVPRPPAAREKLLDELRAQLARTGTE